MRQTMNLYTDSCGIMRTRIVQRGKVYKNNLPTYFDLKIYVACIFYLFSVHIFRLEKWPAIHMFCTTYRNTILINLQISDFYLKTISCVMFEGVITVSCQVLFSEIILLFRSKLMWSDKTIVTCINRQFWLKSEGIN